MVNIVHKKHKAGKPIVFRIWYGDQIVYVGYTSKYITTALRNVCFGINHKVDIRDVTKIQIQGKRSMADAAVYAEYYKQLFMPKLQPTQIRKGPLTIQIPMYGWRQYTSKLFKRWIKQMDQLQRFRHIHDSYDKQIKQKIVRE